MTEWKKKQIAMAAQRREFAAAALAGISSHLRGPEKTQSETTSQAHARWAWGVASAMMKKKVGA